MARYTTNHAYQSQRDGQQFGPWAAGETVDLDPDDAAWVNRDSPGCLDEAGKTVREKPAGANRQHRGGANRGS